MMSRLIKVDIFFIVRLANLVSLFFLNLPRKNKLDKTAAISWLGPVIIRPTCEILADFWLITVWNRAKPGRNAFFLWKNRGFVGKYPCFFIIVELIFLSLRSQNYG